jgi:hypothetical protein
MSTADDQRYVEASLGRALTTSELHEAPSLDALSDEQLAIVQRLRSINLILAKCYIGLIVPSVTNREIVPFLGEVNDLMNARAGASPELRGRAAYERELGRPLAHDELSVVASPADLSQAHLAVARELSRVAPGLGLFYLQSVVPNGPTAELERALNQLDNSQS